MANAVIDDARFIPDGPKGAVHAAASNLLVSVFFSDEYGGSVATA
jgi:hypothetical protein